jgi:aspartate/methionine/tyrosine aminotransferase
MYIPSVHDSHTGMPAPEAIGIPFSTLALERFGACEAEDLLRPRAQSGRDVVQLSGAPRLAPPEHVLVAAQAAMRETGYAHGRGLPVLRQAVARRVERNTGVAVDPDTQVVVTNGAMQALHVIMTALLGAGDEVIIPTPGFSYDGLVKLAGGCPVHVQMSLEDDWAWDMERIEAAVTPHTRLLMVNTPTNPTGRVLSVRETEQLAAIAQRHRLLVVVDEAYDRMVYDGREHHSIYSVPGMAERTLLVQSATKSFAMGAWRIGWLVAPPAFTEAFAKVVEWMMLAVNRVAQAAVEAALSGPQDWLADVGPHFQANRDLAVRLLRTVEGIRFSVPQGAPFLLPDVSALGVSGDEFAHTLITEHGVRITGGSYYHAPQCFRMPFGGTSDAIAECVRRVALAASALTTPA